MFFPPKLRCYRQVDRLLRNFALELQRDGLTARQPSLPLGESCARSVAPDIIPSNIGQKTAIGFIWSTSEIWGGQLIQLLVFVVLARLLEPKDFGLAALLTVFISLFTFFVEQGLPDALIQKEKLHDTEVSTVFWLSLGGSSSARCSPRVFGQSNIYLAPPARFCTGFAVEQPYLGFEFAGGDSGGAVSTPA